MTLQLELEYRNEATKLPSKDVVMGDAEQPLITSVCSLSRNNIVSSVADTHDGQNEPKRKRKRNFFQSNSLSSTQFENSTSNLSKNEDVPVITLDDDDDQWDNGLDQCQHDTLQFKKTKISDVNGCEGGLDSLGAFLVEEELIHPAVDEKTSVIIESDDDIQILEEWSESEKESGVGSECEDSEDGVSHNEGSCSDSPEAKSNFISSSSSYSTSSEEDCEADENTAQTFGQLFVSSLREKEVEDQESDIIIPLDDEDGEDTSHIELSENGQMKCRMCSIVFKSKIRFQMHQRRHFASDHFICPTCFKGFTKFSHCQAHELKVHHESITDATSSYGFRVRNTDKNTGDLNEDDLASYTVTSTCLYPYRGPPVEGTYAPYEIELKYSRSERKSHSRIAAKYTRNRRKQYDDILPARSQSKISAGETRQSEPIHLEDSEDAHDHESSCDEHEKDKEYVPNCLKQKIKPKSFSSSSKKRKWYFCAFCSDYQGGNEYAAQQHRRLHHPEIPLVDVIKFIYYNPAIGKPKTLKKQNSVKVKARRRIIPSPVEVKKIKRKKLKRPKVYRRVWEKLKKPVKKAEFIYALGLVAKTDVVIGSREGTSAVVSSLYRKRKGRRQRSLSPRVRVVINKMPNRTNKTFRVCPSCDFYSPSKSDIRRHRGEVHLNAGTSRPARLAQKQQLSPFGKEIRVAIGRATDSSSFQAPRQNLHWCSQCDYSADSSRELDTHLLERHANRGIIEKLVKSIAAKFIH